MSSVITPVIMSGGAGTRLWPLSRADAPKQLLALVTGMTLLQETAARVRGEGGGVRFDPPLLVANARHAGAVASQLAALDLRPRAIVLEPFGRNTAPVAALAALLEIERGAPESLLLLMPADHHVEDAPAFHRALAAASGLAAAGRIVTFGVRPTRPETGYGYIRRGAALEGGFEVAAFVEKPDAATAETYLADGGYDWNAGIFLFRADRLLEAMAQHCPDVVEGARQALAGAGREDGEIVLDAAAFAACPSRSFDYAVMERTDDAAMVPADIGWSDIGSWQALWEAAKKDEHGVATVGDALVMDSRNVYARSDGPAVMVSGVEDIVVIATRHAVLVVGRDKTQSVKDVVERLKREGRGSLL